MTTEDAHSQPAADAQSTAEPLAPELNQEAVEKPEEKPLSKPPDSGGAAILPPWRRAVVLLSCLIVMFAALAYDYGLARPSAENAHAKIQELAGKRSLVSGRQLSNLDVQKAIERQPSEVQVGKAYYVERYSWRAGLPWKTYDLWVIYTTFEGRHSFYSHMLNDRPAAQFFPDFKPPPRPEFSASELPGEPGSLGGMAPESLKESNPNPIPRAKPPRPPQRLQEFIEREKAAKEEGDKKKQAEDSTQVET